MRRAGRIPLLAALAVATGLGAAGPGRAEAPARVVSINLCADQLAMLLAAEGQLHSVSHVAADPRVSAMAGQAATLRLNHGRAEEIFLMRPDLVIAGDYSAPATVAMLDRLGVPVVAIPAATSLDDIPDRIRAVGAALHRPEAAARLVAGFETRLARLRQDVARRPDAVIYYANGLTAGSQTLAGQILIAAGFDNAAAGAGYGAGMKMPLEVLAMTAPDLVVTARRYPGGSRPEAIMDHPAVQAFRRNGSTAAMVDHDWVCGTPHLLRAIDELAGVRRGLTGRAR